MHIGPSLVGATGIIAHVEFSGVVPTLTWTGSVCSIDPSANWREALSGRMSRWWAWKHSSVSL
jgi:hypothetical protein